MELKTCCSGWIKWLQVSTHGTVHQNLIINIISNDLLSLTTLLIIK